MESKSEIIIYQSLDGSTKVDVRMEDETVWLRQAQLCELFQKSKSTISEHIRNVFDEGELPEDSVVRNFRTTAADGKSYDTAFYNLDVIISVGYRVKSLQGTRFRQWATARLREYIIKGFTMNDELLKQAGGGDYFDELLARIRDIRSSEKVFWRKILDIYATSVDYDPNLEVSVKFFQTVQNKVHYAVHGQTAAEVIFSRIDAGKPNLGLTNFKGDRPTKQETEVAKNYLSKDELERLNRVVTAFLEFAELQALNRRPMHMSDWTKRLDDFLSMAGNELLDNAGSVSRKQALDKAHAEYEKYKALTKDELTAAEKHYLEFLEKEAKQFGSKQRMKTQGDI